MWDHCHKLMPGIIVILQMRPLTDTAIQHPACPHFNHPYACSASDLAPQTRLIHETKAFFWLIYRLMVPVWRQKMSPSRTSQCISRRFIDILLPGLCSSWTAIQSPRPLDGSPGGAATVATDQRRSSPPSHRHAHIHWSQTGAADSSAVVVAPRCFLYHVCQWAIWLAIPFFFFFETYNHWTSRKEACLSALFCIAGPGPLLHITDSRLQSKI